MLCHEIGIYFTLKEASIGPPKIYLGGHVWTVQLDNGVTCWAFGSLQYVQAAVKNVETYLGLSPLSKLTIALNLISCLNLTVMTLHTSSPSLESYVGLLNLDVWIFVWKSL